MATLRKVKFTLAVPGSSIGDCENEEETLTERKGLFHCFGNDLIWDEGRSCFLERMMGFIEEEISGKIHKVFPENIVFEKDDKDWMNNVR